MRLSHGYSQMLRIHGQPEAPVLPPRPLLDVICFMLPPTPQCFTRISPAAARATEVAPCTVSQAAKATPAATPRATPAATPKAAAATEEWMTPVGHQRKRIRLQQPSLEEGRVWAPDVLRNEDGRVNSIRLMVEAAWDLKYSTCPYIFEVFKQAHPSHDNAIYRRPSNGLYYAIQAHLLLSACHSPGDMPFIIPPDVEEMLLPVTEYTQIAGFLEYFDVREEKKVNILRVAV